MHYMFVHGSWHGGWCFEPFVNRLRQKGLSVSCPDLAGHGKKKRPFSEVTYASYYESLEEELKKAPQPLILVAHSMSGIVAAPLLDRYSDCIEHLYLISAYVAQGGKSLLDMALAGGPSVIPGIVSIDELNKTQVLDLKEVKNTLYHDCSEAVADWCTRQLQPQPLTPLITPIDWIDSGKTKHKRTYILCQEDVDVHPTTQEMILATYPCHALRMQAGHFPFLSKPQELYELLVR